MSEFELNYRTDLAIPIAPIASVAERTEWARSRAQEFITASTLVAEAADRIEAALADLAGKADDDSMIALLVSEDASVLAPLTIYTTAQPMSDRAVARFLSTPATLLPPTGQTTQTQHLGVGFSSTLLESSDEVNYSTRRWVFFGESSTVTALLGPVIPAQAIALVEPIAEVFLEASRAVDFEPAQDPHRVTRLLAMTEKVGDKWEI
ncbi:hypothetical protein [Microbacterium esteraromaticum]|uniref:hypothetical protein n=1 Tax=Microbacterium esteraromaticum TaxID=57043 RepID=UPI001C982185|nr:hypothetical protein [Microbacterium esteraromaticum]MBY6060025.1 hypothetical protein [Microbacterium esteraromaticum]